MRGAILWNSGEELEVRDDLELINPTGPREVRVRVRATGLCHSDLHAIDGTMPAPTPLILGHEASGDVLEVGSEVRHIAVGDHVVVTLIPPCGRCTLCLNNQANLCDNVINPFEVPPRYVTGDGTEVFPFGGCGSFVEEMLLPQESVVVIPKDVPWDIASLMGCGVITGVGAAINAAKIEVGASVVVIGCGGVGMSVIQGARIAGAAEIVAVDPVESKFEIAKRFGATHACTPGQLTGIADQIHGGVGFDYGFDVVGNPITIRDTFDSVRRGGTMIVVGVGSMDDVVEFSPFELFFFERKVSGTVYGSSDIRRDCPRLLRLWRAGRLDLEGLITNRIDLGDINKAITALTSGEGVRQVVEF